jgi:putative endonuclease
MFNRCFYVYILTNQLRTVLYTGVTNNLEQRIIEHWLSRGQNKSFTSTYHVYFLLYYEVFKYINDAIAREKELKGWKREKKMKLINQFNSGLEFLNAKLFGKWPPEKITKRF